MSVHPYEVRGSPKFVAFYRGLKPGSRLHRIVEDAIHVLRMNVLAGEKVEKKKWPKAYVDEYRITNLFKLNLDGGYRLSYTIVAGEDRKIACIIEVLDHKAYERRFGYR